MRIEPVRTACIAALLSACLAACYNPAYGPRRIIPAAGAAATVAADQTGHRS